jgi:hypothetical protein
VSGILPSSSASESAMTIDLLPYQILYSPIWTV